MNRLASGGDAAALLARLPRLRITLFGKRLFAWRAWVAAGLFGGCLVLFLLTAARGGYPLAIPFAVIALNMVLFNLLNRLYWRLFKRTRLVLYEYLLIALVLTAGLVRLLGGNVLDVLDSWIIGMAIGLALGRVGCLLGGCCHGRPGRAGVCYPWRLWSSAPQSLNGQTLIPVQGYEALLLSALFLAGLALFARPHMPGDIVLLFFLFYGVGRLGLEFLRGDSRPHLWGLSEAQWISLAILAAVTLAGVLSGTPLAQRWLPYYGPGLAFAVALTLWGRHRWGYPALRPLHGPEIATFTRNLSALRSRFLPTVEVGAGQPTQVQERLAGDLLVNWSLQWQERWVSEVYRFRRASGRLDPATAELACLLASELVGVDGAAAQITVGADGGPALEMSWPSKEKWLETASPARAQKSESAP